MSSMSSGRDSTHYLSQVFIYWINILYAICKFNQHCMDPLRYSYQHFGFIRGLQQVFIYWINILYAICKFKINIVWTPHGTATSIAASFVDCNGAKMIDRQSPQILLYSMLYTCTQYVITILGKPAMGVRPSLTRFSLPCGLPHTASWSPGFDLI